MIERYNEHLAGVNPDRKNPELWAGRLTLGGLQGLSSASESTLLDFILRPSRVNTVRAAVHVPRHTDFIVTSLVLRTFSENDHHRPQEAFAEMSYNVLSSLASFPDLSAVPIELEQSRICRYSKIGTVATGDLMTAMSAAPEGAVTEDQAQRLFAAARNTFVDMQADRILQQVQ